MHPAPHFTQDRHIEWFTSMTGGLIFLKKVGFYVFFFTVNLYHEKNKCQVSNISATGCDCLFLLVRLFCLNSNSLDIFQRIVWPPLVGYVVQVMICLPLGNFPQLVFPFWTTVISCIGLGEWSSHRRLCLNPATCVGKFGFVSWYPLVN